MSKKEEERADATKKGVRKIWIRVQGVPGSRFRVYECLSYARSVDVCIQDDPTLRPRKKRSSGP